MITIDAFKKHALSFPETSEQPHFEKTSFRFGKKIFATLSLEKKLACLKLSELDQSVFCAFDKTIIYPVNNKWGKQGWTLMELSKVKPAMARDALGVAYQEVARIK